MTEYEKLQRLVQREAERLEAEGLGDVIVRAACAEGQFDVELALRTYWRDGEPWYVPVAEARLIKGSIEDRVHTHMAVAA